MIKRLLQTAGRQPAIPVAVLALGGVAGAFALSRSGAARHAGGDVLGALPDSVRHVARDGATAIGTRVARSGNRVGEALSTLGEQTDDAARTARRHLPSRLAPSPLARVRDGVGAMGISEKTVAVFAATALAKFFTGYLRWRGEEKARAQAEALAGDEGRSFGAQLRDHTVVELRQMAADQAIDGRSSMNKDELIEALERR